MNGEQQSPTPQYVPPKPADNPASLTEPSQPLPVSAPKVVDPSPASSQLAAPVPQPSPTVITPAPVPTSAAVAPDNASVAVPGPTPSATPEAPASIRTDFYQPLHATTPTAGSPRADTNNPAVNPSALPADEDVITWTSSGGFLRGTPASIRLKIIGLSIVGAALTLLTTGDVPVAIVVVVVGVIFGILGTRETRPLVYRMDRSGITVDTKHYPYADFKAFTISGYPLSAVTLLPFKRMASAPTLHFDPEMHDRIQAYLGRYLPMEQQRNDIFDKLTSRF